MGVGRSSNPPHCPSREGTLFSITLYEVPLGGVKGWVETHLLYTISPL